MTTKQIKYTVYDPREGSRTLTVDLIPGKGRAGAGVACVPISHLHGSADIDALIEALREARDVLERSAATPAERARAEIHDRIARGDVRGVVDDLLRAQPGGEAPQAPGRKLTPAQAELMAHIVRSPKFPYAMSGVIWRRTLALEKRGMIARSEPAAGFTVTDAGRAALARLNNGEATTKRD